MLGHRITSHKDFFSPKNGQQATRDAFDVPEVNAWATRLYETVELPDKRLKDRLIRIVSRIARRPADSIPHACGMWKDIKGAYRFIENERITKDALVSAARETTVTECEGHRVVLAIQDTMAISFPHAYQTTGLGYVNETPTPGMFMHSVLATREDGIALELLDIQFWARAPNERGKKHIRASTPIEDKESYKWIRGIRAAHEAVAKIEPSRRPRLIHVGDREEDIHEGFEEIIKLGDSAVIRSAQNRHARTRDGETGPAHELVRRQKPLGTVTLPVPRKQGQKARTATLTLRTCPLTIIPCDPYHRERTPIDLTLVEVWEAHPPEGVTPLHWLLWTLEQAHTKKQVLRVIGIYTQRWKIEEMHLILKSGCRIEDLRMDTAERIAKTISIYAPIAVRILQLRDMSRIEPDSPCTIVLRDAEWRALWSKIHGALPSSDTPPPTIRQATLWIGRLGGHIGRKRDGMPGVRTLWKGLRDLALLTSMFELFYH